MLIQSICIQCDISSSTESNACCNKNDLSSLLKDLILSPFFFYVIWHLVIELTFCTHHTLSEKVCIAKLNKGIQFYSHEFVQFAVVNLCTF
jgi:hypothetical protein